MISLYYDFKNYAVNHPKDRAIYYRGRFYNYKYLLSHIDSLASYLKNDMHMHETVKLSICLNNSLFTILFIYACNKLGIILNLINPNLPADQILYFDLLIKSRILFINKSVYLQNPHIYKNIKNKIALINDDDHLIYNDFKYFKNHKSIKTDVPFKYKNKVYDSDINRCDIDLDNMVGLTGGNEKFDEAPLIACALNKALSKAREYQSAIYQDYGAKDMLLSDTNMMSIPNFVSFYHTPLCNGVSLFIANLNDDKDYKKACRNSKITLFSGDIGSYRHLLELKQKDVTKFIRHLKNAYVYNDTQRTYLYDKWVKQNKISFKEVNLITLLGSVETLGVFLMNINDDINPLCFGELLKGYEPCIALKDRHSKVGKLYVKSLATIEGFYKQPDLTDQIFDLNKGILLEFEGGIDINNKFYLSTSKYNIIPYLHNSPYLVNIKDMLMTIPGIKDIDVSIVYNVNDLMEFTLDVEKGQENDVTKQVTTYLDNQFKNKHINYKINYKN